MAIINCPPEHIEQALFVARVRFEHPEHYPYLFAIPNGGFRTKRTAANLKAEGVVPGIPDLFFARALGEWHGLFIEMKRQKNGRTTGVQREKIELFKGEGYRVVVCAGADAAMETFKDYTGEK